MTQWFYYNRNLRYWTELNNEHRDPHEFVVITHVVTIIAEFTLILTGKEYFVNIYTKDSVWERPTEEAKPSTEQVIIYTNNKVLSI